MMLIQSLGMLWGTRLKTGSDVFLSSLTVHSPSPSIMWAVAEGLGIQQAT